MQRATIAVGRAKRGLRMNGAPASALSHVGSRTARGRLALGVALAGIIVSGNVSAAESFDDSARAAHAMLTELCDDFGGRLTGSPANRGGQMRKTIPTTAPKDPDSSGRHGGNRAGRSEKDKQPRRSSQSAGKDPHRGEKQPRPEG